MSTFKVTRNGQSYNVQAASQDEADALIDEKLSLEGGNAPSTFKVTRNGQSYDVQAASQDEADALIDEKLALETIRSTNEADKRDAFLREAGDAAVGTGKALGTVGMSTLGAVPALGFEASKLINDTVAQVFNMLPVSDEWKMQTFDQAVNNVLRSAGLPTGEESVAGRNTQLLGGGLSGIKNAQSAAELLNKGLTPGSTAGRVASMLAEKPVTQAVGVAAGAGATAGAETADIDPTAAQGIGILTSMLAAKGYQNWGAVEKAIANGEIKDSDRAFLLSMAQKYPVLTQTMFPFKGKTGQYVQRLAENTPFIGTSRQVGREAEGQRQAIKDTLEAAGGDVAAGEKMRSGVEDLVAGRGARLSELVGRKQQLLDEAVAKGAIADNTDVSESLKAITSIQQKLAEANNPTAFGSYITKLTQLADSIKASNVRGIELNRKVVSDMRKDASLGNVSKAIDPFTRSLYSSTAKTLSSSVRKALGKEAGDEWETINAQLTQDAADLKNVALKQGINKGADNVNKVQSLVEYAEQNEDPKVIKAMLKDMSSQGRRDLADGILINAMRKAGLGADRDVGAIDLQKLTSELRNTYGPSGMIFEKDQLDRAKSLLQLIKNARPEPGIPNYPHFGLNVKDWLMFIPATTFMHIYNSTPVKNMLIRAKDLDPKSPAYKTLARMFADTVQGQLSASGAFSFDKTGGTSDEN